MSIKRRLLSLVAATAVTSTTAIALVGVGSASATTFTDKLTMTPGTGTASSLADFYTAPGTKCRAGTSAVQLLVYGGDSDTNTAGVQAISPDNPAIMTGNTDYGLVQGPNNNLKVTAAWSLAAMWQDAQISAPGGTFTFDLQCLDGNLQVTDTFTVPVTWTGSASAGTYVASNPVVATSTVLTQSTASGSFGDSVTFTADATDGVAGSVQFKDGSANLGSPQPVSATGIASFTTTGLAVGSHSVTAVFTPSVSGYGPSTSNTVTHTVTAPATTLTLTSNSPTAQYSSATFTATVSPVAAGTVTFKEGTTTLGAGAVSGSGVATYSTNSLSVGAHTITAHFEPTGTGASPADSAPLTHNVTDFVGASVPENLTVTVPDGGLTIALAPGEDGNVSLGTAVMNAGGDLLTASGVMDPVVVTDTRAGDPGWTASGVVTDFTNGGDAINGFNLGWAPHVLATSANQVGLAPGATVAAGTEGTPGSTPSNPAVGLEASRVLAVAADNAGNGTAKLGADLALNIPTDVPGGLYSAVLTLTVA